MRRRPFIVILILLALVLMSAFALAQPEHTSATLVVLKGQAIVVQGSGLFAAAEKIVTPSQAVLVWAGDEIRMGGDAAAQLRLLDGSTVDLDQNTVVQITELQITPESYRVQLHLLAGKLLSRVERVLGSGDRFDITTPSSTASVRGTVFTVAVVAPDITYIACSEGIVAVQMETASALVPAGTELTVIVGQPLQVLPYSEIDDAAAPSLLPVTAPLPQVTPAAMMALPSVAASREESPNAVIDLPGTTPPVGLGSTALPPTTSSSTLPTPTRTNNTVNLPTYTPTAVPFNNTPAVLPPTPAPFSSATPVATVSRTPAPNPNHTTTPIPTAAVTSTQVPTATPAPTSTTAPTQAPIITPPPTSTTAPTQAPTATPPSTSTTAPTQAPTATPVTPPPPTATPLPSSTPAPSPTSGASQVTICHKPNGPNPQTMTIPESDLPGHLGHGDTIGPCP